MSKIDKFISNASKDGFFGKFGGRFVAETLMPLILEVEKAYEKLKDNQNFRSEFQYYLKRFRSKKNQKSPILINSKYQSKTNPIKRSGRFL